MIKGMALLLANQLPPSLLANEISPSRELSLLSPLSSPPTRGWGEGEGGGNDKPVSSISSNKFSTGRAERGAVTANQQHRWDGGRRAFEKALSSDHFR